MIQNETVARELRTWYQDEERRLRTSKAQLDPVVRLAEFDPQLSPTIKTAINCLGLEIDRRLAAIELGNKGWAIAMEENGHG